MLSTECKNKQKIFLFFFLFSLLFSSLPMHAQERTIPISGVVQDMEGEVVIGATVRVKGSTIGTISDASGRFELRVLANSVLVISSIGYETQEISVSGRSDFQIVLKEDVKLLDEVIVIAYGEVKKEDVTGSVGSVSIDELNKAPVASFEQALAGRIAGVQVTSDEGQPGADMNIVIRGGNSLTQSNSPLYVVDGFPIEDFGSASLNPEDIASITVLKDADATSVYGSRAANGVIVIQTKQGIEGRPVISYHGYTGVQSIVKTIEMMDSYEFVKFMIERDPVDLYARYITRPGLTMEDYKSQPSIDWQDVVFSPAFMQNHWLAMRGGTKQTKYNVSTSFFDQDGIAPNSGFNRLQGRMALTQTVNDNLDVAINVNYSQMKNYGLLASQQGSSSNAYSTYLLYQTWGNRPVLREGEDIYSNLFPDADEGEDETVRIFNPLVAAKNQIRQQVRNDLLSNIKIDYTFGKGFTFTSRGGVIKRGIRNESFYNSKTYQGYPFNNNLRGVHGNFIDIQRFIWSTEQLMNYNGLIKRGHRVNALLGVSMQGNDMARYGFGVNNIVREDMGLASLHFGEPSSIDARRSRDLLASYFTRVNYTLQGRYVFSASFRADGSSRFNPAQRWGYFPSGGFTWRMNRENFMRELEFISGARLRLSYGATGNNRVGDFSRYSSLNIVADYYSFNNEIPIAGARFNNLRDPNLRWETTLQSNIGYDLSLFDDRINLVADLYRKTTKDLLLKADIPGTTGFLNMYRNVGTVTNDGLELALTTQNIKNRNFTWESTFNISFNRNKVRSLTFNQNMLMSRVNWTNAYNQSNLYVAQIGQSAANFYGFIWEGNYQYSDFDQNPDGSYTLKNTVPTNGASREGIQPGDIKYADLNGDRVVNEDDMTIIGRALPIHIGGFNNNFSYKGFDLNLFFQWSYGNDIFNANRLAFEGNFGNRNINQYATYINRWTEENQNNTYFRTRGQGPQGMYSSRTIEDGSFLRLKTVQLSYTLPKSFVERLMISNMSVYVSGQDLLTWTKYSGVDPEVSVRNSALTPGFDYSAYPRAKTITFGIRTDF